MPACRLLLFLFYIRRSRFFVSFGRSLLNFSALFRFDLMYDRFTISFAFFVRFQAAAEDHAVDSFQNWHSFGYDHH